MFLVDGGQEGGEHLTRSVRGSTLPTVAIIQTFLAATIESSSISNLNILEVFKSLDLSPSASDIAQYYTVERNYIATSDR